MSRAITPACFFGALERPCEKVLVVVSTRKLACDGLEALSNPLELVLRVRLRCAEDTVTPHEQECREPCTRGSRGASLSSRRRLATGRNGRAAHPAMVERNPARLSNVGAPPTFGDHRTEGHGTRAGQCVHCGPATIALISPPAAGLVQAGESDRPSVHPQAMQVDRLPEFFSNNPLLCMAFLAILGGIAWTFLQGSARGVRKLSPSDVTRLINHEDAIVLDVRSDGEFRQGHIVNAMNIPDSQLADRIDKLNKYRSRPIIATCRTGRSA